MNDANTETPVLWPPHGLRNLPNPGIEPRSPILQVDSLPAKLPGKPIYIYIIYIYIYMKEISPGCSLEGMMLKLKLQYFDHLNAKS